MATHIPHYIVSFKTRPLKSSKTRTKAILATLNNAKAPKYKVHLSQLYDGIWDLHASSYSVLPISKCYAQFSQCAHFVSISYASWNPQVLHFYVIDIFCKCFVLHNCIIMSEKYTFERVIAFSLQIDSKTSKHIFIKIWIKRNYFQT